MHNRCTKISKTKMNSNSILVFFIFFACINVCFSDCDNLQDTCPTDTGKQTLFINGFRCKNPSTISASDFKSTKLSHPGDTDNFIHSSVSIVTAAEFPGLNTLGLSIARTDIEVDGIVLPHSHPRASELLFVSKGTVLAGFVDTSSNLFQKFLKQGDVMVFPRGLLHFCLNSGYEFATAFSVLSSQNPGVVTLSSAMFEADEDLMNRIKRFISVHASEGKNIRNITLHAGASSFSLPLN